MGLQFRIVYKKGVENCAADPLSHRPNMSKDDASLHLHTLSTFLAVPVWFVSGGTRI